LENPDRIVLLDDMLARRTAKIAGLQVWGTLKVLLEAKSHRIIETVGPYMSKLSDSGMWMSAEIRKRILKLAGES
jgi:predicted nucleic acid-binding protein